jgi:hypothetical protein
MSENPTHTGSDQLAALHALVGKWQGMTNTWFEPEKLGDTSPWQAEIRPILGGRYVQYEYTASMQGETFMGQAIIGHNSMSGQFEMAWIDSFHQSNGIMHCKGEAIPSGLRVLGSYIPYEGMEAWGWLTVFELVDADHLTVRAYNVEPGTGTEYLGVETQYTRV